MPDHPAASLHLLGDVHNFAPAVLGAVFGMARTLVSSAVLRTELWAIDGTALVVSTCVLALYFFRQGCDGVAAGFLVSDSKRQELSSFTIRIVKNPRR